MLTVLALMALVVVVLSTARFAAGAGDATHPFSVHDLLAMDRVSDLHASPDGIQLVFVVRVTDLEANKGRANLWLCARDGSGPRQLTTHEAGGSHPRWESNGRLIYFLSARGGSTQVWSIAADGGEAQQVTDLPLDVGSFALSRDGRFVAVGMEVFPDADTLAETKGRLEKIAKRKASGRVYDRLFVRHWDTWKDGRRSHLFVVPTAGGEPIDVMQGMDADVPTKPFGGAEEYTFTPDGKLLVFAARNVGREEAWSTRFDLFVVPADGSAEPEVVVDGKGATVTNPAFSPDGKTLAYLAMTRAGYEADRLRIALKEWPAGAPHMLTEKWDRSAAKIVWAHDGRTIYTYANDLGQTPLFAVDVARGEVRKLVGEGKVTEITIAGDRIVYGLCHHRNPVELYSMPIEVPRDDDEDDDDAPPRSIEPITRINADKLAAVRMGESEQFTFEGWNDETVYAYVVKPVDFDPKKEYPLAFLIHGGPQGSFGNDFHYRWNPQVYAGAGYAALMIDFHASTGYGQEFVDAINDHWGDRPLEDLQKGLAAALAKYEWMDAERVAALGASYGGYMVNWIHGKWSEPFRCLVCHDGNLDERMAYFDTEELWFPEWERGGPPWEKPKAYTKHNPIDYVKKWSKPTLVIHGQKDYRVVDAQGISTFTALQRLGIPSRLLHFPDENHWVLKPHNSIQWHEEVIGWLNRWCLETSV